MKALAKYLRASQEDGGLGESATIQNQRDLLDAFIKSTGEFEGWTILEFADDGWSGTTFDRPGVQRLLQLAGKTVSCIIVKDVSRFGRNLVEVGNYLDQVFPFLGVRFISVNEAYDSAKNAGRTLGLDVSLKAMIYELYSRDLSKKIGSVKEAQLREGNYLGRMAFYGYQKSAAEKHRLLADPEAARIVRRIFSLAASGKRPGQIALLLNEAQIPPPSRYRREKDPAVIAGACAPSQYTVWTPGTVRAILQDERYTGCAIGHRRMRAALSAKRTRRPAQEEWIRVENAHEAVVSPALFRQAQGALQSGRGHAQLSRPSELFRGILKCGLCGKTLRKFPGGKQPYYRCMTGKYAPSLPCAAVWIDRALLEQALGQSLRMQRLLGAPDGQARAKGNANGAQALPARLQRESARLGIAQLALFEKFAVGRLYAADYAAQKGVLDRKAADLAQQLSLAKARAQDALAANPAPCPGKSDALLTRETLEGAVKEIRVFGENRIEIIWNFRDGLPPSG